IAERFAWKMLSVPALLRFTLPDGLATGGTALVALLAVAAVVQVGARASIASGLSVAVLAGGGMNPHFCSYDVLVLLPAILLLVDAPAGHRARLAVATGFVLSWLTPMLWAATNSGPLWLLGAPWGALGVVALTALAVVEANRTGD